MQQFHQYPGQFGQIQNLSMSQSMRVYEDLVEQNLKLRQHIEKLKLQKPQSYSTVLQQQNRQYSPLNIHNDNYSTQHHIPLSSFGQQAIQKSPLNPSQYKRYQIQQSNQKYLQQILQRNRYLQQKINRLRNIYQKQYNDISTIRHSKRWEERYDCKQDNCYQDKYMHLLRIRSPFF